MTGLAQILLHGRRELVNNAYITWAISRTPNKLGFRELNLQGISSCLLILINSLHGITPIMSL